MRRQSIAQTQPKSETPLTSSILQRAAVISLPEKAVPPVRETENKTPRESCFQHDFSHIPTSTKVTTTIQPKLTIGAVGDKYEQEADRVAAKVVSEINTPQTVQREEIPKDEENSKLQMKPLEIQRQETSKDDEDKKLQMNPLLQLQAGTNEMAATPDIEASIQQQRGSGQKLAESIRKPMENYFGVDFSSVKVHTDTRSDQLNQSIQAKAFTTGQDIFFRQGAYQPGSSTGQELLAHELTHVVQQNNSTLQRKPKLVKEVNHSSQMAPTLQRVAVKLIAGVDADKPSTYDTGGGHSYADHGAHTTEQQQRNRLATGVAPSGRNSPVPPSAGASKFASNAKHVVAFKAAYAELVGKNKNKTKAKGMTGSIPVAGAGPIYYRDGSEKLGNQAQVDLQKVGGTDDTFYLNTMFPMP